MKNYVVDIVLIGLMIIMSISIVVVINGCTSIASDRNFDYVVDCNSCTFQMDGTAAGEEKHFIKGF